MTSSLVISLDGMGGDAAPQIVVGGAALARERIPQVRFILYGDEARLRELVAQHAILKDCMEIRHAEQVVSNHEKPSVALRQFKQSSMRLAIDAVKAGEAHCVVSAGNTGALMAIAKFVLRSLPGVDRPAIVSFFPTLRGESAMLDLGANVECDATNLVQFAVMGEAFARTVLGIRKPSIGLLNVGEEELKGKEVLREAADRLRNSALPLHFHGFVEGNDIAAGTVDVIVTDGFTGNVALKTAEGTSKLITSFLREAFESSLSAKLGYLLARRRMNNLRARVDPRRYNGAVFLGLDGIAVKSHGGTDALGFANAIGVAADMTIHGFIEKMKRDIAALQHADPQSAEDSAK